MVFSTGTIDCPGECPINIDRERGGMDRSGAYAPFSAHACSDAAPPAVSVSLLALPESTPTALFGLFEVLSSAGVT
jgi:hypothetical protein